MSNPQQTFAKMDQTEQNLNLNPPKNYKVYFPIQSPVYTPVQPVPVVARGETPMAIPVTQAQPIFVPVQYQTQGPTKSQQSNNNPQVIVIDERCSRPNKKSWRNCYCKGPKPSTCGYCDPNEEYCRIMLFLLIF